MASDHSITVWENEWYDHATEQGGGPVSFVQIFYGLSYPEAVTRLLDGEQGQVYEPAQKQREDPKKEFVQPPVNTDTANCCSAGIGTRVCPTRQQHSRAAPAIALLG